MDFSLDAFTVHEFELFAPNRRLVNPRPEFLDLVGLIGDVQDAGFLQVARDPVGAGEVDEGAEVGDALPLEGREFIREVANAIRKSMGQAGRTEAAVSPAGPEPDGLRLEDDHLQVRGGIGQGDRGPQAREPAANDDDIRAPVGGQ